MYSIFDLPLSSVDLEVLQDLQRRYPNAVIRVEAEDQLGTTSVSEDFFWGIIAQFDWGRKRPQDVMAPAIMALSAYGEAEIFAFEECLAQKLYALDTELHAKQIGWGQEGAFFSPDGFLYNRCAVVANGNDFYVKVLNTPELMSVDISFEPILYLAEKAYQLKTGKNDYDYLPNTNFETFANTKGWPDGPNMEKFLMNN